MMGKRRYFFFSKKHTVLTYLYLTKQNRPEDEMCFVCVGRKGLKLSSCNLTPFPPPHDMSAHGACDVSMSSLSSQLAKYAFAE